MRLEDACLLIADCPHTTAPDEGEGYPLVRTPNVGFGRLVYDSMHRVSEEVYLGRNRRATPQAGDLIYAREAPAGNVAVIREGEKVCLGQRTVLLRPNPCIVDSNYLAYYLLAPENRHRLVSQASGATVAHVNIPVIRDLPVSFPNLQKQQKAAAILNDLYSAIDNARRQIALLEEAAMRLYREWFGDGKGKKKPLGEFVEITTSGSWGTDAKTVKTPNEVVCIRGADFEEIHGRSLGKQIRRFISDKHLVERSLKDGDLVVEMSGGSPTQSTGRVVSISDMLLARYGVPVLATNFCKVVRPKSGYSHFLYLAWRDLYVSRIMFNYEVGTTGIKNFDYDLFVSDVEVTNPLPKLTQFNGLVDGMFSSIDMLGSLVQDLTEARDRLLPKLMSGEIEV